MKIAVSGVVLVIAGLAGTANAQSSSSKGAIEAKTAEYAEALSGSPEQAASAARTLARLGTAESAAALRSLAEAAGPLQALAVAGLATAGPPHHADALLTGLVAERAEVRAEAVWGVGAWATRDWTRPLSFLLTDRRLHRGRVGGRAAVIDAIGLAGLDEMLTDVAGFGDSSEAALRAASIRALAGLAHPTAQRLRAERLSAHPELTEAPGGVTPLRALPVSTAALGSALPREIEALRTVRDDGSRTLVDRAAAAFELAKREAAEGRPAPPSPRSPRLVRLAGTLGPVAAGLSPEPHRADYRALRYLLSLPSGVWTPDDAPWLREVEWKFQGSTPPASSATVPAAQTSPANKGASSASPDGQGRGPELAPPEPGSDTK